MLKNNGILIGGVFVGAVVAEIINKKCPDIGKKVETKISEISCTVKEAFKAGYANATKSCKTTEV